ncbi:uncharacterized protein LOC119160144 isoform X3 [Rhipicephalus microplus]|uniref:uncharacterized protein LOC119160144 isoform X3 n=1 Tax=Rhipicephalus microplus TaxID=6941 RepID=UPI003F6BAECA
MSDKDEAAEQRARKTAAAHPRRLYMMINWARFMEHSQFTDVPPELCPLIIIHSVDMFVPKDSWDDAATEYVKTAIESANSVQVEVLGQTVSGGLYGKLHIECKKKVISLDEELVSLNYAFLDSDAGSEEILLEDHKSLLGTSTDEQYMTHKAVVSITTKSSSDRKNHHQKKTSAALPKVHDVQVSSSSTEANPPSKEPPPASTSTKAASCLSEAPCALASLCEKPNIVNSMNVNAEKRDVLVLAQSHEVESCASTLAIALKEGAEQGTDTWETVSLTSEGQQGSSIECHSSKEEDMPGIVAEERKQKPLKQLATAPVPNKVSPPELHATELKGFGNGTDKAHNLPAYPSARSSVVLLQATLPPSTIMTRAQSSKPVNTQDKKPVQGRQHEFSSQCMSAGRNRLQTSRKTLKLWDVLKKRGSALSEAHLQNLRSTFKKPQVTDKLTSHVKPDETTEKTASCEKDEALTPTSNVNPSTTEPPSCVNSAKSQPTSEKTASNKTADESIDYSDFMSPCHIVEEIVDPDVEEAKWNLKFDTEVADLAAINVCQAPEDFRHHDFQSFSEVPQELDPYAEFEDAPYFSADFDSCKLPAQLANSKARAVCHGSIAPQPITHLDKTCFDASLKERLRSLGFRRPSCIQSVVWPAVSTGRNVVAVATPHTGKTLAYLIPLVSRMLTEIDYHQLPTGCGPLMLILTSTWQGAHRIYEQVNLLVEENAKCPKCCILYAGGSEDGKEIPIINGCDILVATPHSFLRFLNNYERLIVNMYRCCHLVLDDGERLLDTFTAEVTAVLEEFLECQKKRQSCLKFAQIIVCSTMWTSGLDWFLRTYIVQQTPLVILSSFSEAAIYAAVPTLACYVEPHAQNDALLNIVKGNASRKVVVCAAERETAIAAHHLLVSQDLYSLLLHDELPVAKISEVSSEWTSEHTKVDMPILVIQDKVLPLTNIRDADVLVHYDIPELSQFNFGFRYSCIADHMRSFRDKDDFYTSERPVVHMILSSNNRSISVQLVEFLNRLGSKVPDGLAQLASEEKEMRVSSSAELPLCPNLKAFGRCERQSSESGCSYRHQILPETDHAPCWSYLPSQGSVRIAITKVTSASHFYAQILQQWNKPSGPASGNEPEVKENLELQEAKSLLNEYFSNVENRVPFDAKATPTVGQVYGLEASANQYERVLVTSVTSSNSAPASVTVTHLDYGGHSTVSASRLFHLPPKLTMIRPLAVEVYCCGMQPPDGDLSWTFQADFRAHNLFFRKELVGEIVLRLGNTLWLDRLVFQEKLRFAGTRVSLQNMRTTLVKEGFANTNPSHMERLRKMATDAGVTVPALPAEVEGPSSLNNRLDTTLKHPCTTHLDTMDYNHVFLWKVMSPSHFYVQPCKFITNLDELEKNIENAVRRQTLKKLKSVHTGVLCIARCSNNGWYRGEVKEILNDEEVVVSFHDYGDFETCCVNNLLEPLPWMLLLPYQALSCSLAGIGPTSGEWSPKAQSVLEDFGYDKDFNRALCLRVAKKKAGDWPGTSHYEVFLFDSCSSGRIGANDVLVKQGLAVPTEVPELDFDISVPHESFQKDEVVLESESDDENDSVISDSKKFQKEYELCSLRYALQEIFTQVHSEDDTVSDEEAEDEAATELPTNDPGHGRNKFTDKYGVCPSKAIAVDLENKKQSHKEGSSMYVNSESLPTATSSSAKSCVDDSSCENGGGVYVSKATSAAVDFMSHSESTIPSDNTSLSSTKDKDATVVASTLHQCTNKKPASKKKKKTKRAARVSWKDAVKDGLQTLDSQFKTESSRQPTVSWWQDRNFVHLDVSVMNVPEYKLNLTASMLCLRITTEKQEFLLHEKLYAAIEPTQSNITVKLKSLALKLKKAKGELNWKALTRHKQKMPYIRYDLDHVGLNNSDDDIIIACEACKDPSYTGPDPTTKVLPYDPVAHKERTLDIEAAKVIDDFPDEVYYNLDPNNIFEDLD